MKPIRDIGYRFREERPLVYFTVCSGWRVKRQGRIGDDDLSAAHFAAITRSRARRMPAMSITAGQSVASRIDFPRAAREVFEFYEDAASYISHSVSAFSCLTACALLRFLGRFDG